MAKNKTLAELDAEIKKLDEINTKLLSKIEAVELSIKKKKLLLAKLELESLKK